MRTKTTLFLFVLLVVLGPVAFYVLRGRIIHPAAATGGILPPEEAAVLDYLKFEFRDRAEPIVIEKQGEQWRITEPVLWPANIIAIEHLVTQLQFLKKQSSFPAERLADYKLDPPEGTLTYGFGSVRHTLRIGMQTDMARNVYLLPDEGDEIVVAKADVLTDLKRPLEELRDNKIFSVPLFEVRNWNVQIAEAGNLRVHLVREGEKWRLETPFRARADKAAVDTLLKNVLELRVDRFWREGKPDLNVLGLASPQFRITVVGSSRDALLLGNQPDPTGQPNVFWAKREDNNDTVFTVRVDCIDDLRNAQTALRDRRVVEFEPERLQSLTLVPAGQPPVTLQRLETGAWQVLTRTAERGLVSMDGDPNLILNLVQEIAELRAVRDKGFVSEAPSATDLDREYGLTGAAWQIQIAERAPAGGGEPRVQTLTLGRRPDDSHQFARADEGYVYLVDRALADDLHSEAYYYRNRLLRQMAAGEKVTALSLKRLANDEVVFSAALVDSETSWPDALITQNPERRNAALALINELRTLRARTILAPEFPKTVPGTEMKPWTWLLEVTVTLEGGATPQVTQQRLYLDEFKGGTDLIIGDPNLNLAATAEPGLIDALRPLIFERRDPGLPANPEADTDDKPDAAPAATPAAPATGG